MKLNLLENKPVSWIFWHPHQRLWNRTLVRAIRKVFPLSLINVPLIKMIICLDTFLLFTRCLLRRLIILGPVKMFSKMNVPEEISLVYFDLGTHREGAELTLMVREILPKICSRYKAYGFEASRESYELVREKFSGNDNVHLIHKALCKKLPVNGKVKLYHHGRMGIGDSLFRESTTFEEVEAIRFSDWLQQNKIILHNNICLLRMNIEGSEYDLLQDLIENGYAKNIDGYYGMWDDLSKIDLQEDKLFRLFLAKNNIHTLTFNGRDLQYSFRVRCIKYDIETSVRRGLLRLEKNIHTQGE